jgi:hypothetical protein
LREPGDHHHPDRVRDEGSEAAAGAAASLEGDETGFIACALRSAVVPVMIVSRRHRTVGIAAQRVIPRDLLGRPCGAAKSF